MQLHFERQASAQADPSSPSWFGGRVDSSYPHKYAANSLVGPAVSKIKSVVITVCLLYRIYTPTAIPIAPKSDKTLQTNDTVMPCYWGYTVFHIHTYGSCGTAGFGG